MKVIRVSDEAYQAALETAARHGVTIGQAVDLLLGTAGKEALRGDRGVESRLESLEREIEELRGEVKKAQEWVHDASSQRVYKAEPASSSHPIQRRSRWVREVDSAKGSWTEHRSRIGRWEES